MKPFFYEVESYVQLSVPILLLPLMHALAEDVAKYKFLLIRDEVGFISNHMGLLIQSLGVLC